MSLEEPFWAALADIAKTQGRSIAALVSEIDKTRSNADGNAASLSAAIRLYVLDYMRGEPS